ncbi:suppressor of cytokine signaling 5-like [Pararge aegeria]|uniref:Jg17971 protein n=2 Tax=Pararge aegeria TaxID=116150 RepID=A0A8S4S1S9_9NEOP|nr:suppressor of cytokine signaling 5-like [Pararge aegeria]CAH2244497.1 jg17971 [Pararge aegeria aegeria]
MNKNYERCTHCNRRKWLATGCLRKWLKPMECKHLQRTVDSKRDFNNTDIVNRVYLPERMPPVNTNKFVRFWKNKLFVAGSVRSLQRYFGNKNIGGEHLCSLGKANEPSTSTEKHIVTKLDIKKDLELEKSNIKCQHADGHSVLRGHHQHISVESCAIYCQLSKHGWYWGGITSSEAEKLLAGQHDNVFLVRDSYDSRHILCVSFRCVGRTLHARLRHANGLFSLNNETYVPANRISEHCATVAVKSKLFEMPVKLARPLNRFAKLDSLQKYCRFVVRQTVSDKLWNKLPLPTNLISYVSLGSDYIAPL